jgi:hypothetical protein
MRLLTIKGMQIHPRWFRCLHPSYWKEVERQSEYWAARHREQNARRRAARVERPTSYA